MKRLVCLLILCVSLSMSGCSWYTSAPKWNETGVNDSLNYLSKVLSSGHKVSLVVVGGQVKPDTAHKEMVITFAEQYWLSRLGGKSNFVLVDRGNLKTVINELELSQSGLVSNDVRAKVGELTGATHILVAGYSGVSQGFGFSNAKVLWKLVDIQTGRILAMDFLSWSEFTLL